MGMGGGGISHPRPLLLLFHLSFLFCPFPFGIQANSCHKYYRSLYLGKTQGSFLTTHTHVDRYCYDPPKLETCTQDGQTYWVAENLGQGGQRLRREYLKGERWFCFTFVLGGGVQDLVKEQVVNEITKQMPQSNPGSTPREDLYKKLKRRLENEIQIPRVGKTCL